MRIILVTRTGCPHCTTFKNSPAWKTLQKTLLRGGANTVEEIDIATREGAASVPPAVRKELKFVPQIFALRDDGSVMMPSNPITTDAGVKELNQWASPPNDISDLPETASLDEDEDDLIDPTMEVVVVTSSSCPYCLMWESSGKLKSFLDSLPSDVARSHFNVMEGQPPRSTDEARRRSALAGVKVPSVVAVKQSKWDKPSTSGLEGRDVLLSPGDPRSPTGLELFNKWLGYLKNTDDKPFIGYLVLATNPGCGHCRVWKESGGMDKFVATHNNIPGLLLVHVGMTPTADARVPTTVRIGSYPSLWFISAPDWSSPHPEVMAGPDPRNTGAVDTWIDGLVNSVDWTNNPSFIPPGLAAASRQKTTARKPLSRQFVK